MSLKSTTAIDIYVLSNLFFSWGKTREIAHVPSPSSGTAQKTIFARHIAEATCRLRMGCWCQNTTHNYSMFWSSQQLSTAHQFGVVTVTLAS